MKKVIRASFIVFMILISFQSCKVAEDGDPTENPVPVLTSLSPSSKVAHMPAFTLTAKGTDFVTHSVILFNGSAKKTTHVSSTELTCRVEPDEIAAAAAGLSGVLTGNITVQIRNPQPGGGDSDSLDFTVNDNHTFYVSREITGKSSPQFPAIAADSAGNINVVCDNFSQGKYDVFFIRSTDGGSSWSSPANISNNNEDSELPDIAVDQAGNIDVFWENHILLQSEIYFKRSTDGGTTWSRAVNVSGNSGYSAQPDTVVDEAGSIDVAWHDDTPGNAEIFFSRSTDNGADWSPAVNVSTSPALSVRPDIAVDSSGNIALVWLEVDSGYWQVFFSRSTDSGDSWSTPKKISYLWGNSYFPFISIDNAGKINVAWENESFGNIFFTRSVDDGTSWSQAAKITANLGTSYGFSGTVDSARNIDVVYANGTPGNTDIFFIRSTDNGANWSQAVNISNITGESKWPVIGVDGDGNIDVVWLNGDYLYSTGSTR